MTQLKILETGARTCLQDGGRFGFQAYGVGPSGAMDRVSLAIANTLIGKSATACAIEFSQLGGKFEVVEGELVIALVGGATLEIDGEKKASLTAYRVLAGQKFSVSRLKNGNYAYLGFAGELTTLKPELSAFAYHARADLGKTLQSGDVLDLSPTSPPLLTLPSFEISRDIHVVFGPQDDYFSKETLHAFCESDFKISALADRMGVRLEGATFTHTQGFNIVSDGIATGAIQIPGNGVPIVLLADRQTTGGYPKIATIVSSDLPRFVQLQAGESLRFTPVSQQEAISLTRAFHTRFTAYLASATPRGEGFSSERLLSLNLIDGFVSP